MPPSHRTSSVLVNPSGRRLRLIHPGGSGSYANSRIDLVVGTFRSGYAWRCFSRQANRNDRRVCNFGLACQLGVIEYSRDRNFASGMESG
jgi:hypothetical protein